jgi:TonB family protein
MGQYNVDVRVINVESGTIAATEGATFAGSSYREGMKNLATKLASQIATGAGPTVSTDSAQLSSTSQNQTNVITLLNYLHIFPENLGTFEEVPRHIILHLNQSQQYGYGSWRLPTEEELSLMRANNLIGYGNYMTCENQKGIVRLVTDKEAGVIITDGEYIAPKNIYMDVESMPEFLGGQQAMMKFLAENIQYPVIAQENGIQGRVICQIVIEKDGSITNVKVAQSSGETFFDKEAIRVLTSMPKWKPGRHRGELVRVLYTIPITFRLK